STLVKAKHRTMSTGDRRIQRHVGAIHSRPEISSGHSYDRIGLEAQFRPEQRDFERCGTSVVADERVRRAVSHSVEGTANRHSARLMSPAATILNGREHSPADDGDVTAGTVFGT